jgi:eukaryotic-like serine/threonine-protein kinase
MRDETIAGRYRLIEPLGRGSMSAVWLAHDEELGRRVAVKMLAPSADRARFEREARAAAALSHPNIVSLYDYGEADGRPFMILECLPGGSLEERLRGSKPLPDDEAEDVARDVAAGLAHAHARDLVHRDLKPANILFDGEGRAKIADFGIARMRGTGTLTEAGTVLGTASYISPEQAAGETAGPASDVYSFGVILFRMLTGRLPFVSTNAMDLVRMHRDEQPPAVGSLRPDAPPVLREVATASLAKDPARRPADGAALLAALAGADAAAATMVAAPAAAAGTDATQVIARPATPARPQRRRNLAVPAAIAAAVLLLGGGALALVLTNGGGSDEPGVSTQQGLSLPNVSSAASTTAPTTVETEPTTTEPTTTAPRTTTRATTTAPTTTAPTTTTPPPTTTAPVTTAPPPPTTTVAPPTTTAPPVTTDTIPTTTVVPDEDTTVTTP